MTAARARNALLASGDRRRVRSSAVTAATSASQPPALKNGGTLTIGLAEDPDALDPTLARTFVGRMIFMHMCEKLYDIDSHLNIVPQLAAAMPKFSTNKKTVTIKLRTGLKFNDGTTLDAAAVKQSLDRHKTLARSARASELAPVTSVDTQGNNTVILHLTNRYAPITAQLADRSGMVMSPKALNDLGANFATNPVCVGPFMFKDRQAGDHITLVKSPYYYAKNKVHLDSIVFKIITDPSARSQNLRAHDDRRRGPHPVDGAAGDRARLEPARRQVDLDRLPGHHDQHREQERAQQDLREHRHDVREVGRPAAGVRARARPQADQQGRLRRHAAAGLLPVPAGEPVLRRDEGDQVPPDGERRGGQGGVQEVGRERTGGRAPDDRNRSDRGAARRAHPGRRRRRSGSTSSSSRRSSRRRSTGRTPATSRRSQSAGRGASTRTATSTNSSTRRARRTTAATRTRPSTRRRTRRAPSLKLNKRIAFYHSALVQVAKDLPLIYLYYPINRFGVAKTVGGVQHLRRRPDPRAVRRLQEVGT